MIPWSGQRGSRRPLGGAARHGRLEPTFIGRWRRRPRRQRRRPSPTTPCRPIVECGLGSACYRLKPWSMSLGIYPSGSSRFSGLRPGPAVCLMRFLRLHDARRASDGPATARPCFESAPTARRSALRRDLHVLGAIAPAVQQSNRASTGVRRVGGLKTRNLNRRPDNVDCHRVGRHSRQLSYRLTRLS